MLNEVHVPEDVSSAVALLGPGVEVLGGGTSLMPWLNDYASRPTELVSLRRAGLTGIAVEDRRVSIGAATTLSQIEDDARLALLNPVVRSIGSVPVRTLATVGGNLFARQPHGDLAVALVALAAEADVVGLEGTEVAPVEDLVTATAPPSATAGGRLVTAVRFALPDAGTFRYAKAARRRFNSVSIVTVAATIREQDGVVAEARIALGGVGPHVIRAHVAEEALLGGPLDETTVGEAARAGLAEIDPADDAYATSWYRRRVFPVHLRRALLGH